MDRKMFDNVPLEQRAQLLEDNCLSHDLAIVKRHFTAAELEEMRVDFTDKSIECAKLRTELKALVAPLKAEIKLQDAVISEQLKHLENRFSEEEEMVYFFDDQESGMMNTYDATGELIASRKLTPKEKQTRIIELNQQKTA